MNRESIIAVTNRILTGFAISYPRLENGFIGDKLFRILPVADYAGLYKKYLKSYRVTNDKAGLRGKANEIDDSDSSSDETFYCQLHTLAAFISKREMDIAVDAMNPRIAKTEKLTRDILINREKRIRDLIDAGVAGATGTDWSPDATTIEANVWTAIETVKAAVGVKPNTLALGDDVYAALLKNAELRKLWTAIPGMRAGEASKMSLETLFSTLFNIKNVIVGSAFEDTTKRNNVSSFSDIWSGRALFAYIEPGRISTDTLTLGVQFVKENMVIDEWVNNNPKGQFVRNESWQDERLICATAGYLLKTLTLT